MEVLTKRALTRDLVQFLYFGIWSNVSSEICSNEVNTTQGYALNTSVHTSEITASFRGSRLVISGRQDANSGVALITLDKVNSTVDTFSSVSKCGVYFDKTMSDDIHSFRMQLLPVQSNQRSESATPQLHVHEIAYYFDREVEFPSAPVTKSGSSTPVAAIVLPVLGSIIGLILLTWGYRWVRRRLRSTRRRELEAQSTSPTEAFLPMEPMFTANMMEHRTDTTISYGQSEHVVSNPASISPNVPPPAPSPPAPPVPSIPPLSLVLPRSPILPPSRAVSPPPIPPPSYTLENVEPPPYIPPEG
ncbi:hypothetical protein QCA50_008217 [Cerrena zonata]|uniref:Uncharacterized protein n=1 Tax=Cerrena zonata TaxID=2478898 RepID=A0AAW0GAN0_9APHY